MPRHEHVTDRDADGREICRFCHQVIIKPILSSDDARLKDAGFNRSGGRQEPVDEVVVPLPELLIALYYDGAAFNLGNAPAAHYVHLTAQAEGNKSEGTIDPEQIWMNLFRGWDAKRTS